MSSSSWSPQTYSSGCWISQHHYEGPYGSKFTVHATLEAGADKYFSGIRVRIGCKDTQELAAVTISDNMASDALHSSLHHDPSLDKAVMPIRFFTAQQNGCTLAKQWQEGDPDAATALPLCTLVFEIVEGTWKRVNIVLHPPEAKETQTLRTLYDYVEPYTPPSRSCVLFLKINDMFRTSLNPNPSRTTSSRSATMSILTHGVNILPPSASRPPSINLPVELLHMIFKEAVKNKFQYRWRATLISFALVCRAWRPALDHLFEHFGPFNASSIRPDALQLARRLKLNPELGMKIRVFDPSHFRIAEETVDFAKAIVTILQTAVMVKDLCVFGMHRTLARDFVAALCSSSEVESFTTTLNGPVSKDRYMLSVDDIIQCLSHWPRVHTLSIYSFSESSTCEVNGLPTPSCLIKNLFLQHGSLTFPQFHLLTKSSCSTLQNVTLKQISGLTNEDLRTWLLDVGLVLTSLSIQFTPISRRSEDVEYAVDVVLPIMINLRHLELEGDIASELVLLRYTPYELRKPGRGNWNTLAIDNMPGVDVHGFVSALKATGWTHITATNIVLREDNTKWKAEATKIANDRNIFLIM